MRQSIGASTTFKAALLFTLIFSAFLALAITYNKVFRLKNESIAIVERYEGISSKSIQIINNYLRNSGYQGKGHCDTSEYGLSDFESDKLETVATDKLYYYCVANECTEGKCNRITSDNSNMIIYKLKFFYKFNLPVFGDIFNYTISGKTRRIKYYTDKQLLENNRED